MPELPEVQTIVNELSKSSLPGASISHVQALWNRSLVQYSENQLTDVLRYKKVARISRRAKFIVIHFTSSEIVAIHLRMSGRLHWTALTEPIGPYERVVLGCTNGMSLRLHDTRKFARVYYSKTFEELDKKLGPEPLDSEFTETKFAKICRRRSRRIKPLLLDQTILAGIGNIYADEALFCAGIHPERHANSLNKNEIKKLYCCIRSVLKLGIRRMGTTLGTGKANFYSVAGRRGRNSDSLKVFRRTGESCVICKSIIERKIVAQRSSHICPSCQR